MKKYLFVMQRAPHVGLHVAETLDMILTTAAFDQAVSLLFIDQGVLQLKNQQNPAGLGLKDSAAVFLALEIYDVTELYIEIESLQATGLQASDLILPVKMLYRHEISEFIQKFDVVIPD